MGEYGESVLLRWVTTSKLLLATVSLVTEPWPRSAGVVLSTVRLERDSQTWVTAERSSTGQVGRQLQLLKWWNMAKELVKEGRWLKLVS